jgi:lipoyl(octanoyl) transferase
MNLEILPTRIAGAAENMAVDFLLLQRYPKPAVARFRHYGWRAPAWTFGYSQKIAFVRGRLPSDSSGDLCRRPTGGGIVDHREDWTYALVIPRGHALEEQRATESYRIVHERLATALGAQGVPCVAKASPDETAGDPLLEASAKEGVCFQRVELYDVVHAKTGAKIAGAAQKRNKHGLLFQGSIWRPAVLSHPGGAAFDWERFEADFAAQLADALGAEAVTTPWPEFNEDELGALVEQYSSPEWRDFR